MEWLITRTVDFTIEQVTSVVEKCETASKKLITMMDELVSNMKESIFGNEMIVSSAQGIDEECGKSLKYVSFMQESVTERVQAVRVLSIYSEM